MMENELIESVLVQKTVLKNFKWEPPDEDTIKINSYACFHQESNTSRACTIARNKERLVMAKRIYPSKNIATPAMAEAWACLHVVIFGEDLGFRHNCVEGDSLASHTLAKAGWHHEQPEYWMEEAPVSVVELVERERTGNETGVRE
ncbi:hypothetical protein GOBAR_AA07224 [Gossypium barbadense]|uniref:RNase H type-1 domain-containing protein n=1 Tax=Gossypium barbadense TaxID=3634 RepID=A0A2P5YCP6_GOSBA|nr:hypothetical protein GOBAR_AA07224 [Gossypium barbadense]